MPLIYEWTKDVGYVVELGAGNGKGATYALAQGVKDCGKEIKLLITVDPQYNIQEEDKPEISYWLPIEGELDEWETLDKVKQVMGKWVPQLIYVNGADYTAQVPELVSIWKNYCAFTTRWLFHGSYPPHGLVDTAINDLCFKFPFYQRRQLSFDYGGLTLVSSY